MHNRVMYLRLLYSGKLIFVKEKSLRCLRSSSRHHFLASSLTVHRLIDAQPAFDAASGADLDLTNLGMYAIFLLDF
jgi:F420-0:gamma-glutamyl ligase-like protein